MNSLPFLPAASTLPLKNVQVLLMDAFRALFEIHPIYVIAFIVTVGISALGIWKKKGRVMTGKPGRQRVQVWKSAMWSWVPERRIALLVAALLVLSGAIFATVQEMMTMQGQIDGAKELQSYAMVVIVPKERGAADEFIEGKAVFADQGGHFTIHWMWPGDYQMLILTQKGSTLYYSVAHSSKGWLGSKEVISTNLRQMKLVRKVLDDFAFGKADLPGGAAETFKVSRQSESAESIYLFMGHADSEGSDRVNEELGMQRARNGAGVVVDQRVPKNKVIIVSLGSKVPAQTPPGPNNTAARDRRVVMVMVPDPYAILTNLVENRPDDKKTVGSANAIR